MIRYRNLHVKFLNLINTKSIILTLSIRLIYKFLNLNNYSQYLKNCLIIYLKYDINLLLDLIFWIFYNRYFLNHYCLFQIQFFLCFVHRFLCESRPECLYSDYVLYFGYSQGIMMIVLFANFYRKAYKKKQEWLRTY